ncbi:MAG: hypothetical protein ACOX15_10260 [Tepidanaerobacteraceae bacterium]
MTDSFNTGKSELLGTVLDVIQGKKGQNANEIISLLALSNLLGIISFLNIQDQQGFKSYKQEPSELKNMASSLLASLGGIDKKLNPAMLANLLKTLSATENSEKDLKKSEEADEAQD